MPKLFLIHNASVVNTMINVILFSMHFCFQRQLEEEKKLKKREKERARKERLKSEGKLLTEKEKQDRRRFNQMLESMKEQGEWIEVVGGILVLSV